jgi:hypothetical protein
MADSTLTDLTQISAPDLADITYLVDVSDTTDDASGSSRKVSLTRLLGALDPGLAQGRLTLESGVSVSTTDQTAKTSLFYTPHAGNRICLYDGTRWRAYSFAELTIALGTLTNAKNYDVFLYDNAGTLTGEFSAAWTNDTTRADALALQDGVWVKSGAATRRWLGTFRTTATTTTEDSLANRLLYNAQNQVVRLARREDSTAAHAQVTGSWREWKGGTLTRVTFVLGQPQMLLATAQGGIYSIPAGGYGELVLWADGDYFTPDAYGIGVAGGALGLNTGYSDSRAFSIGYHYVGLAEQPGPGPSNLSTYIDGLTLVQLRH